MTGDACIALWVREKREMRTLTLAEWIVSGDFDPDEVPQLVAVMRTRGCAGPWFELSMVTDVVAFERQVKAMDIGPPPPPPPFIPI